MAGVTASPVRANTVGEEQTRELAARLAAALRPGDVLALVGDLGSGKTRFVQGLARGLGSPADALVVSPTFTLLAVYSRGRLPLYHFDLYRLRDERDLECIGAEEYLWGDGVCAVEWAERAPAMMPDGALWVHFSFAGEHRRIAFSSSDARWAARLREYLPEEQGG
jgi:tRNA threonylcarbamoyladenosine biosynthesis protein TsaE